MGYRSNYRSNYRRRPTVGRVAKVNARPGPCHYCAEEVPAGAGQLYRESGGSWSAVHVEESQGGWLMNPQPVTGGCPGETDKRNAELLAAGFFGPDVRTVASERDRIASRAARHAAAAPPARSDSRGKYAYTASGARMTMSSRRCEDAPCCGCCD